MSDITLSNLVASPGLDQVVLTFDYIDPNTNPALQLAAVEVWIAKVNDRTQASEFGETLTPFDTFTHAVPAHTGANYYWVRARDASGDVGAWFPEDTTAGVRATALGAPNVPGVNFGLVGGKITVSVDSGNLTVAIKTLDGEDPSPEHPVLFGYQDAGLFFDTPITAPTAITVPSGSTLETSADEPFRLWVTAFDTGVLGLVNALQPSTSIKILYEAIPEAPSSALPWNASGVIYANENIGARPYRLLAHLSWDSGLAVPGVWDALPTLNESVRPSDPRPGDIVRSIAKRGFGLSPFSVQIPCDNTPPLDTEGTELTTFSFPVTSVCNLLDVEVVVSGEHTQTSSMALALHRSGVSEALAVVSVFNAPFRNFEAVLRHIFPVGAGSTDFTVRIGSDAVGTGQAGSAGNTNYAGRRQAYLRVSEIKA